MKKVILIEKLLRDADTISVKLETEQRLNLSTAIKLYGDVGSNYNG